MRPEPRWMTLGDAMALSVGVAVALALPRFFGGWGYYPGLISPAVMLLLVILTMIWAAGMAISFAILARLMRYRRQAGPGEWLAFLLTAMGIVALAPNIVPFAEEPLVRSTGLGFSTVRWLIAGGWTLAILAGLGLIRLSHRRVPAWVGTIVLIGLAVIAIGGPFSTIQKEGPFLVNPVERLGNSPVGLFLLQSSEIVATTPYVLMVAVPTMALVARWPSRRTWPWTEWAGPLLCLPTLGYSYFQRSTFFPTGSGYWYADQAFGIAWLVVVAVLGRGIVRWWTRGERGARDQTPEPGAIDSSPASTRAT